MSFQITKATRAGIIPLIGMFGKSGSGKTMSALLVGRGLAGNRPLRLIDSENGRGSIFADLIPGGYEVINLSEPFSPERYTEALVTASDGAGCVVVDSLSHEHTGEGGVLDMQEAELARMAGDDWKKREACKMAAWIKPKNAHKKFINQHLLRTLVPLICCLRGEEKTHIIKEDNKNKVITDQFSTPIFDPRFLFELLVCLETVGYDGVGGYVIPRKITHPDIAGCLPPNNEQIGIKNGEMIARWAANPGAKPVDQKPEKKTVSSDDLRAKIVAMAATGGINEEGLRDCLVANSLMTKDEWFADLSSKRLIEIGAGLKAKLSEAGVTQ